MVEARKRSVRERLQALLIATLTAAVCFSLVGGDPRAQADPAAAREDVSMLWQHPADLAQRDLFHGPGGPGRVPDVSAPFRMIKEDRSGYSTGYDVMGADGTTWSVKLGPEAQTEVVSSRVLWAIGYHQVPTYHVTQWEMIGAEERLAPGPARFRPELTDRKVVADWSWHENPFTGTQPYRGLIVANLMLNSWDWKTSNNKIYDLVQPTTTPTRMYVVRDLGASLGRTSSPKMLRWLRFRGFQGNRNDVEGFERQGFIRSVTGDDVEFDYKGIYGDIVDLVTPQDVVWTSRLLAMISDKQWDDAFRAAGYADDEKRRFIAKLKSKIAEGLALGVSE